MPTTTTSTGSGHPISVLVARMRADLNDVVDEPVWSLNGRSTRDLLLDLTRLTTQVTELETRIAEHADTTRAFEETGATSTANGWAHATHQTRTQAHRKIRLAKGLETHGPVRQAMARGHVLPEQAQVIIDAVDALPVMKEEAVTTLLAEAEHHDAIALKRLGRHVLDVVDPEVGEAHQAKLLDAEEASAAAATRLTMTADGQGRVHLRGTIPALHGAMLKKALLAIAAPKHQTAVHSHLPERRPSPQRLGQAFCEYLERYPADRLPQVGGNNATIVVQMSLESLLGGLAPALLDTGEEIPASQARRLACEAGIIPAVLGTDAVVLDLGRETRFHTRYQRTALAVRQQTCTRTGCDWPAWLCHVHHGIPWSRGGPTDVAHAQFLCPRHHTLAHRDPPMRT